jgi:hypothetical protein
MIIKPYIIKKNSGIQDIPDDTFKKKKLIKVNFSKNRIKVIPQTINELKNVEVLDLSNNRINQLFANLFALKKLKALILNNNKISSLPRQILNLKRLQKLHLSANKLKDLPPELGNLVELKELNISRNEIEIFPESIFKLKKLENLWIGGNPITYFPVDRIISELPQLKRIYCYSKMLNPGSTDMNYIKLSSIRGNSIKFLKSIDPSLSPVPNIKHQIFVSYAHEDIKWFKKVKLNLNALSYDLNTVEIWSDEKIMAGDKWNDEIKEAIKKCSICILLISTNFLGSDFIRKEELPAILMEARDRGVKILCLILSHCKFQTNKELKVFQTINKPDRPLDSLKKTEQDKVLTQMTETIEKLIG